MWLYAPSLCSDFQGKRKKRTIFFKKNKILPFHQKGNLAQKILWRHSYAIYIISMDSKNLSARLHLIKTVCTI
jgi:hypothetical protein